jgi:predicted PurR-regulated permease PerM
MKAPNLAGLEDKTFLLLVVVISLAFAWILWPFFGAVLWGTILSIVFSPLHRSLLKLMAQRRTTAALATVTIVLLIVILPVTLIGALLVQEALNIYEKFQSGEINIGLYLKQVLGALPTWASDLLDRFGLRNLGAIQERFSDRLVQGSQFVAGKVLNVGQNTFEFVVNLGIVLYLLFFLLRDGDQLTRQIRTALPLHPDQQRELFSRFTTVVRATVKGNVVVAIIQGALGGLIFWFFGIHAPVLWAVLMAFVSLLPAIGPALIWLPVALYLMVTGAMWQGIVLIAYGTLVIGLVDNILRPILVGKDTNMPDYVVLIATLGGMVLFGINGFVIGPLIAALFIAVWDIVASSRAANPS